MERAPWRAPQPLTALCELTGEAKPLILLNTHDNSTMAHIPDHDRTTTRGRNGCRRHLVAHMEAWWRVRRFSSREACECRSDDAPPLPTAPCEKDCCDSGWDRCCDPAATAAAAAEEPAPPLPPVLLKAAETQNQAIACVRTQNNGGSRGARWRNWWAGFTGEGGRRWS